MLELGMVGAAAEISIPCQYMMLY